MKKIWILFLLFVSVFFLASCNITINTTTFHFGEIINEEKEVIIGETIDLTIDKKENEEIKIINEDVIEYDENNAKLKGIKVGMAFIELIKNNNVKKRYTITVRSGKYDGKITEKKFSNNFSEIEVGEAKVVQTSTIAKLTSSNEDVIKIIDNNIIYGVSEGCAVIDYDGIKKEVKVVSNNRVSDLEENVVNISNKVLSSVVTVFNYQKGNNYEYAIYAFGSGTIYKIDDDNIYILTNRHVVMDSEVIQVYFKGNGEKVYARLLSYDDMVDLAVILVKRSDVKDASSLTECKFGLASEAKVGQFALTVGSPLDFELEGAVCFGIISKKDVYLEDDIDYDGKYEYFNKFIQVDASINSGNSGGPLFDMNGHVIGINTAKYDSSIADNLGFSIPSDIVFCVIDRLENASKIKYKTLGISVYTIDQIIDYDIDYNIPDIDYGAIVSSVSEDSLASKSGILEGDVITKINDVKVLKSKYLLTEFLYSNFREDELVVLEIYRDNEFITITIDLNEETNNQE